jgi:chromosomal replication initiation ATPase DnaA
MLQQLLPLPPAPIKSDIVIGDSNRIAVRTVLETPWPSHTLYLYGEMGCGKTLIATQWAEPHQALWMEATDISAQIHTIANGHYVLEQPEKTDETALFHLLNVIRETESCLLLSSRLAPSALPFTLPDLTSRLRALPTAAIFPPHDDVIHAMLWQHCITRQLRVEAGVLDYLLTRIPRSYAAIQEVVARLDSYSLAAKRAVTLPLARKVLEDYISP